MRTIVLLGRYGDIINLLPLAHYFGSCNWVVGAEYADVFKGVSYVNPIVYPNGPDYFVKATNWARRKYPVVMPAQVYTNPGTKRRFESYNLESWALAGEWFPKHSSLELWGHRPLVFDRRDKNREDKLVGDTLRDVDSRPIVLVATRSLSSPFKQIAELLAKLRGLDANIIDMSSVKAERVYDMIRLFDRAACLVTVDTVHLHLARASYCPTVAITNDGWCGSVTPPQAIYEYKYNNGSCDIDSVVEATADILNRRLIKPGICMAADRHKDHDAQSTWPYVPTKYTYKRSSKFELKDNRDLPYFKDVLENAMQWRDGDLVIWTNCDVGFTFSGLDKIIQHAKRWDFGCTRRDADHIGRECFWFRRQWLKDNIDSMPDVILGAPKCDLVIAKWLRSYYGINSELKSLKYDFAPVDCPPGIVYHESHPSAWLDHQDSPSAKWNESLWNQK